MENKKMVNLMFIGIIINIIAAFLSAWNNKLELTIFHTSCVFMLIYWMREE